MEEQRLDMRLFTEEEQARDVAEARLCFRINHTEPFSPELDRLLRNLFGSIGEGSRIMPPLTVVRGRMVKIGRGCVVMNNSLFMAAGGIEIGDGAMIAANAQLLSNSHDPLDHFILTCKPVRIGRNVWIGAGATILPGVEIGDNAIIGAGAVVTRNVAAGTVAAGVPARIIKAAGAPPSQ